MRDWLRHAFAIEPAGAFAPMKTEAELVERVCVELARRNLVLPASVLLESFQPLGTLGAQALWFSVPWFAAITDATGLKVLAQMLERPGAVDYMLEQLQAADAAVNVPAQTPNASDEAEGTPH